MVDAYPEYDNKSPNELNEMMQEIESNLVNFKIIVNVENEKMEKYKVKYM